jgi:hypothetical protein
MRRTKCPECGKVAVAHYPAKNFMQSANVWSVVTVNEVIKCIR